MNLNLSGSLGVFKLLVRPSLCLPHLTIATFADLPLPLSSALSKQFNKPVEIKAVVLDKDDCFALPNTNQIHKPYADHFQSLRTAYPGRRLLIVSNTAGALSHDPQMTKAAELERATGVAVLPHRSKKPGCAAEIMHYFRQHPETGVTGPEHVAVVGDRLATDVMLANQMGSWAVWVKDGVVPLENKSVFSKVEQRLGPYLMSRGLTAPEPRSPFE